MKVKDLRPAELLQLVDEIVHLTPAEIVIKYGELTPHEAVKQWEL